MALVKLSLIGVGTAGLFVGITLESRLVFCVSALLVVIVMAVILWMPSASREAAEQSLQEIEKEIGLRPYTRAEAKALMQAERENYNKNMRSAVLWTPGGTTYIDYDGNIRNAQTNEIEGFAYYPKRR